MSAVLTPPRSAPPPAPLPPGPKRWTVAEFHRLKDLGTFGDRRPFLLGGVIWEQGPMGAPHDNGIERADAAVRAAFGPGWRFRVQLALVVDADEDPVPDIAVVRGTLTGSPGHPTTADLVIEVADSSLAVDTTAKAERYATAGVPDYWVLDVNAGRLLVFRDPRPLPAGLGATAYRTHRALGPADTIAPLAAPAAVVKVADLLP